MLASADFPYLQSFVVNDAYAVKNLTVPIFEGAEFKHLILTGKNGSGKTTVLRAVERLFRFNPRIEVTIFEHISTLKKLNKSDNSEARKKEREAEIHHLSRVELTFSKDETLPQNRFENLKHNSILAFFEATRKVVLKDVETITKEADLVTQVAQTIPITPPPHFSNNTLSIKKSSKFLT